MFSYKIVTLSPSTFVSANLREHIQDNNYCEVDSLSFRVVNCQLERFLLFESNLLLVIVIVIERK